jgi:hypothetical protein
LKEDNIIIRKENDDDGLDNFNYVKATKYGNNLDLMACTNSFKKGNQKPNCKKICKGMYINTVTNEYIKAKEHINRGENFRLLKKSADNLYKLIHANFYKNIGYHCVLTYRNPPQNTNELYRDFKIFWQKIRYYYPDMGYISVLEPTQKGVWHIHLLLKNVKGSNTFVSFFKIKQCWISGYCYISKMRENVDYGQYFRKKIRFDNGLLNLYQPGVRYFRHSRNIKKPITFTVNKTEVMDKLVSKGGYKLLNQYSLSITKFDNDGEVTLNKIFYQKYKK